MISLNRLASLIKRAVITRAGNDDGNFAIQQISYNGKAGDCNIIFPYGMHANLPVDALITVVSINANEENRDGIGGSPEKRIRNLPEGEVVFFHPTTKSKFHFKNNGDVDIEANGALNINVTGDVDLTATNVNVDALVNLGVGGLAIARVGDAVSVTVSGGSSAGTHPGTITTGGVNKSL